MASAENKQHAQRVLGYVGEIARTSSTPERRSRWIQSIRTVELVLPAEYGQGEDRMR